jgi:hypothetical protein
VTLIFFRQNQVLRRFHPLTVNGQNKLSVQVTYKTFTGAFQSLLGKRSNLFSGILSVEAHPFLYQPCLSFTCTPRNKLTDIFCTLVS